MGSAEDRPNRCRCGIPSGDPAENCTTGKRWRNGAKLQCVQASSVPCRASRITAGPTTSVRREIQSQGERKKRHDDCPEQRTDMKKLYIDTYGCQMNVYRFRADHRLAGSFGICPDRERRRCGSGDPEHLPYSREGNGKGLFRTWQTEADEGSRRARGAKHFHRRRGMRGAGRRRRDDVTATGGRYRCWTAILSSLACVNRSSLTR